MPLLGVFMGLFVWFFANSAAGQKLDKPTTIVGRIVDDQRRPVAGADVWMPLPDGTPHATSDAQGSYVLMLPATWVHVPENQGQWIVWAHARNRRIALANAWAALFDKPGSVNLTLAPATDTSFVVLGPDGRPLANAVVEPHLIRAPNNCYLTPPTDMQQAIRTTTDGTGRALLPAIAWEGFGSVRITAASLGSQAISLLAPVGALPPVGSNGRTPRAESNSLTERVHRELRLRPAGRIEGRIEADRPEWTRGVKIYVSTTDTAGLEGGLAEVSSGDDGHFVVPAIAAGKLKVFLRLDPSSPVRPRPVTDVEIRGNETTNFVISLEKKVVDSGSP